MSTKLTLKIGKRPNPDEALSAKEIRVNKRMLRAVFGNTTPAHKMPFLLPGSETANVEVQITELQQWAETEVKPKAGLAAAGGGEFCPGSWCQFCKIAPTCRARAEGNLQLAKLEFAPPTELTDVQFAHVLARISQLKTWASDVAAAAEAAGYKGIYERKLITLTAMKRLMGKPAFNEILGDLVIKSAGKPTLMPASDKRPPLDLVSAASRFQPSK